MFRKQKRNPHRAVSRRKLSGSHTGGQIQRMYEPKWLGKKRTWLKMEGIGERLETLWAPKAIAAQSWLAHLKVMRREKKKNPCLGPKQEKCPKLISIREPKALFPHKISWENYRIMIGFGKQTSRLELALVPPHSLFCGHKGTFIWKSVTSVNTFGWNSQGLWEIMEAMKNYSGKTVLTGKPSGKGNSSFTKANFLWFGLKHVKYIFQENCNYLSLFILLLW